MKIDKEIIGRFEVLIKTCRENLSTIFVETGHGMTVKIKGSQLPTNINTLGNIQWALNSLNLISRIFGESSVYYKKFEEIYPKLTDEKNREVVKQALAILVAAKDDYENDYLFDTRTLIAAEIFDDFLEQADHLFNASYFAASAVIAGSVLEDAWRKLCVKNGITLMAKPKLDTMNADLAKSRCLQLTQTKTDNRFG